MFSLVKQLKIWKSSRVACFKCLWLNSTQLLFKIRGGYISCVMLKSDNVSLLLVIWSTGNRWGALQRNKINIHLQSIPDLEWLVNTICLHSFFFFRIMQNLFVLTLQLIMPTRAVWPVFLCQDNLYPLFACFFFSSWVIALHLTLRRCPPVLSSASTLPLSVHTRSLHHHRAS